MTILASPQGRLSNAAPLVRLREPGTHQAVRWAEADRLTTPASWEARSSFPALPATRTGGAGVRLWYGSSARNR